MNRFHTEVEMSAQYKSEEKKIDELVGEGIWGRRYLDIGGFDPIELSNTYHLYKQGWNGDIYEPLPEYEELYRKVRPRDRFFNLAVSNSDGQTPFWINQGLNRCVSTLEEGWVQRLPYEYRKVNVTQVDAHTLEGVYDLCSLDVEGHESTIIHRIDFDKLRIGVLLVESLQHGTCLPTYSEWESVLIKAGFEFVGQCSPLNRFYRNLAYFG